MNIAKNKANTELLVDVDQQQHTKNTLNVAHPDDMTIVQQRLRSELLGNLTATVATQHSQSTALSQDPNGSWPDINYHDRSRSQWIPAQHLQRLALLSQTYALTPSPSLLQQIHRGLQFFRAEKPHSDNWWYTSIHSPRALGQILVLLTTTPHFAAAACPSIPAAAALCGNVNLKTTQYQGANLMDVVSNLLHFAVVVNDPSLLLLCAQRIKNAVRIESSLHQEGIQVDGSFHQVCLLPTPL